MKDLSPTVNPAGSPMSLLVPSSQEGGNMIQEDLAKNTMTAPGSEPVAPLPAAVEGSHPIPEQSGKTIPVSHPGQHSPPAVQGSQHGGGRWGDIDSVGAAKLWKQM